MPMSEEEKKRRVEALFDRKRGAKHQKPPEPPPITEWMRKMTGALQDAATSERMIVLSAIRLSDGVHVGLACGMEGPDDDGMINVYPIAELLGKDGVNEYYAGKEVAIVEQAGYEGEHEVKIAEEVKGDER
jgi:hypothetical protein